MRHNPAPAEGARRAVPPPASRRAGLPRLSAREARGRGQPTQCLERGGATDAPPALHFMAVGAARAVGVLRSRRRRLFPYMLGSRSFSGASGLAQMHVPVRVCRYMCQAGWRPWTFRCLIGAIGLHYWGWRPLSVWLFPLRLDPFVSAANGFALPSWLAGPGPSVA